MEFIDILGICIVVLVGFYILGRYAAPILPAPWGAIFMAVVAVLVIIFVLLPLIGIRIS